MLKTRIITASLLVPPILAAIAWLPNTPFAWVIATLMGIGAWEWTQFAVIHNRATRLTFALLVTFGIGLGAVSLPASASALICVGALGVWGLAMAWLAKYKVGGHVTPTVRACKGFFGVAILFSAGLSLATLLAQPTQGRYWLLFLLAVIWCADIGAYTAGRLWGHHKLAPNISPNKTWEGVIGGLTAVLLLATGVAFAAGFSLTQSVYLVAVSIASGAISIVGDLFVSLMKRQVGLKDSGRLFPGHGGLLDRLDSLLGAAPLFYMGKTWLL